MPLTSEQMEIAEKEIRAALDKGIACQAIFGQSPISNNRVSIHKIDDTGTLVECYSPTAWHDIGYGKGAFRWLHLESLHNFRVPAENIQS